MFSTLLFAFFSQLFVSPGAAPSPGGGPAQPTATLDCEVSATYLNDGVVHSLSEDGTAFLGTDVEVTMSVHNVGTNAAEDVVNTFAILTGVRGVSYVAPFDQTLTLLPGQSITQTHTLSAGTVGGATGTGKVSVFVHADSPNDFAHAGASVPHRECRLHFWVEEEPR